MAKIIAGGIELDTKGIRAKIADLIGGTKKTVAAAVEGQLQAFIDDLNANSTRRRSTLESMGIDPGKYVVNEPFKNAKVVVR